MKYTKLIWCVVAVLMVTAFLSLAPVHAEEQYRKKIILFSEKTRWPEIRAYAKKWKKRGVVISMEIPIINGLVAGVPSGVTDTELAADPRVSSIETNLQLSGNAEAKSQGTSFIKPLQRAPKVDAAGHRYEAPWSILKLFDQPYDNRYFSGWLSPDHLPDSVVEALHKLNETTPAIAVFDTGIDDIHHYTRNIVETGVNVEAFAENAGMLQLEEGPSFDDNGHGSHIGGILGAILDKAHSWGQEADVDLNSVKVLGDDGMGYLSNIIYGLQWAIDNDIRIANLSIAYTQDSPAVQRAVREASKAGVIMLASVGNKSNYDPNVTLKITADGGAADGGAADGGAADGGAADGGAADGGAADGGAADGGAADGGAADGGAADGGAADGGAADGGAADGGAADGGAADGGAADGGAADGGAADGGAADGGAADGGAADGGAADGGAADGGAADGGAADGGAADGGAADGGAADGGAADGGAADGGAADGGAADGGAADGGAADGGAADGGAADGALGNGLPQFSVMYPARYPEVIAVGASNAYGKLATFSNSGEEMDIMAPGANILSVDITNGDLYTGLGTCSGTSMSVPYVTAAVAMMLALDPTMTADEIKDILTKTAHIENVDSPAGDLNLVAALEEVKYRMEEDQLQKSKNRQKIHRKILSRELQKSYRNQLKEKIRAARMADAGKPGKK